MLPGNLVNDSLIRSDSATSSLAIDAEAFMNFGGGRYAKPSQFSVVEAFFNQNNNLAVGSYTMNSILAALGLNITATKAKFAGWRWPE